MESWEMGIRDRLSPARIPFEQLLLGWKSKGSADRLVNEGVTPPGRGAQYALSFWTCGQAAWFSAACWAITPYRKLNTAETPLRA
jgi:hypothetical protein